MPAKRKPARRPARRTPARPAARKPARASKPARRATPSRPKPAAKRAVPKPKRATPEPKRAQRRAAAPKRAAPKQRAAKTRASTRRNPSRSSTTRRAPAARTRSLSRRRPTPGAIVPESAEPEVRPDDESWPDEPAFAGPMIRGQAPAATAEAGERTAPWEVTASAEPERAREVYTEDIPIAFVAAGLAVSAFLPWYKAESAVNLTVTAWASGTWGPIIFFLALGSFLLVAFRRFGVTLSLPFEEALLHEFAGWVALAGGVIKSRYRPGVEGLLGVSWGLFVGLGAAFVLAFLAGRMSPHAPLVRRPKWYRARGGVTAALLFLVVIGGAAAFGTINSTKLFGSPVSPDNLPGLVRGRLPDCAGDFPLPAIVKPIQGVEQPCQAHLQSDRPGAEVIAAMKTTLEGAGWTVIAGTTGPTSTLTLTKPQCATVAVVGAEQGSVAVVAFGICTTPSPSPSG